MHMHICITTLIPRYTQGIYPTVTIVLVRLKFAYADQISRAETLAWQTTESPHQNGGPKCRDNTCDPRNPGATSIPSEMMMLSIEGLEASSHGGDIMSYDVKPDGLNAVEGSGVGSCAIKWPQIGKNEAKGDMRLRYGSTSSGIRVNFSLEDERKMMGPGDRVAHAV